MLPELPLEVNLGSTHVNRRGDLASDSEEGSPIKSPDAVDVPLSPLKIPLFNGRPLSFASMSIPRLGMHTRNTGGQDENGSRRSETLDSPLGSVSRLPVGTNDSWSFFVESPTDGRARRSAQRLESRRHDTGTTDDPVMTPQQRHITSQVDEVPAQRSTTPLGNGREDSGRFGARRRSESSEEQQDDFDESEIYDTTMQDASLIKESSTPSGPK